MRVLYVINGLGTGGAERSLAEMLPLLAERGVEAHVACLFRRVEGVQEEVLATGVPVSFLDSASLAGRVKELRSIIGRLRPDLIHTTIYEADLVGRLAATATSSKVLCSLVNTSYASARLGDARINRTKLKAVQLIEAATGRVLVDHFHAITAAVRDAAVRDLKVPARRVTVIHRGRDPDRLGMPSRDRSREARRKLDLGEDEVVLLNIGRHEYQKGQRHLVEAAASDELRDRNFVVLIAGRDGNETAALRSQIAAAGLSERVRLLGHRNDVVDVLAAADVFVFPSLYEGLGGALIEAMALGLPIVASDIPAIREVVAPDENAILVPPAAPGDLAAAISRVVGDETLRRRFGAESRSRFERMFTLEKSARSMFELYGRVLAA